MSPGRWVRLDEDPTLARRLPALQAGGAAFLVEVTAGHRDRLAREQPHHQWAWVDGDGPGAVLHAVGLAWDGTTADAPAGGAGQALAARPDVADTLAVLDLVVVPERRGQGLGGRLLGDLDGLRARAGLERLLVLQRPHGKRHHPLVPFGRYVAATDEQGTPRDGWLAAAWAAGLHPVLAVDRSLVVRAPVAAFEAWYGRPFPTSGPYLLPGAIKPAIVEHERDEGRYREPHLWMAPAGHLRQRTVDADALRTPADAWRRALAAVGLVPGSRRHREVRRRLVP